jgi:hypothetical protein
MMSSKVFMFVYQHVSDLPYFGESKAPLDGPFPARFSLKQNI